MLSELNDLVSHPQGIAQRPPDFRAITQRLLHAFVDQPFESSGTLPELDKEAIEVKARIEHAIFLPEEIHRMTAELLGCELLGKGTYSVQESANWCQRAAPAYFALLLLKSESGRISKPVSFSARCKKVARKRRS